MAIKLVVTNPFKGYEVGQEITDPALIKDALDNSPAHVVKVAAPDAPAAPSAPSSTASTPSA